MDTYGTLYIVATPIGNLEDMTFRAIRILKEVDLILCEDTRTTSKLLNKYDIKNKTSSYHAHSTTGKESAIIRMLEEGKNIALVSDAGDTMYFRPRRYSSSRTCVKHLVIKLEWYQYQARAHSSPHFQPVEYLLLIFYSLVFFRTKRGERLSSVR
jgi:hypothetical protein